MSLKSISLGSIGGLVAVLVSAVAAARGPLHDPPSRLASQDSEPDASPAQTVLVTRPDVPLGYDAPLEQPVARQREWFFAVDGGPSYERIYGGPIYGGRLSLGADLELKRVAVTLGANLSYGHLDTGLGALHLGLGPTLAARMGAVHLGAGFGVGFLSISTVTSDSAAVAATLDIWALGSVDVASIDAQSGSVVYVGLKLAGSLVLASDANPMVWGPSLLAGLRL